MVEHCPVCLGKFAELKAWPGGCGHSFCASCLQQVLLRNRQRAPCPICRRSEIPAAAKRSRDPRVKAAFGAFATAFKELVSAPSEELVQRVRSLLRALPELGDESSETSRWCGTAGAVTSAVLEEANVQRRDAPEWLQTVLLHLQDLPCWHGQALLCEGIFNHVAPEVSDEVCCAFRRPDLEALVVLQVRLVEQHMGGRYIPAHHVDYEASTEEALEKLRPFAGLVNSQSLLNQYSHCWWDQRVNVIATELMTGWDL